MIFTGDDCHLKSEFKKIFFLIEHGLNPKSGFTEKAFIRETSTLNDTGHVNDIQ